jgi:hypothetical protein
VLGLLRCTPHDPHRWAEWQPDLPDDLEAIPLVVRDERRLRRFEVGGEPVAIAAVEDRGQDRASEALPW